MNLQNLSPILKNFEVRVDKEGREVEMPMPEVPDADPTSTNAVKIVYPPDFQKLKDAYDSATTLIRMPTMLPFVESVRKNGSGSPFEDEQHEIDVKELTQIFQYGVEIKVKPELFRYVPCKDGKVLEKPEEYDVWCNSDDLCWTNEREHEFQNYLEATQRVLFHGWEVVVNKSDGVSIMNSTGCCITFRTSGEVWIASTEFKAQVVTTYEEAFRTPHYVELSKIEG